MNSSDTERAFCYLERVNDEKNKISLTESNLIINYRNRLERFELVQVKHLSCGHRKATLYLISGGIMVPFTAVAFSRNFLDPWPTLFLLFTGIFAIYLGWQGYQVLSIHLFGLTRDYKLRSVSDNIQAFVDFTLRYLPVNISLGKDYQRMIYHITDIPSWKKHKTPIHFIRSGTEAFIHASTYQQLEKTREKYFKGKSGLLLLTIDPLKVNPEIRFEDLAGEGQLFPHIYGDLNLNAVVKVEELN